MTLVSSAASIGIGYHMLCKAFLLTSCKVNKVMGLALLTFAE